MTEQELRDHFAGLAMQSLITMSAPGYEPFNGSKEHREGTAALAYAMASDMMTERMKRWPETDFEKKYKHLSRKVAHGCTDAYCGECDAE